MGELPLGGVRDIYGSLLHRLFLTALRALFPSRHCACSVDGMVHRLEEFRLDFLKSQLVFAISLLERGADDEAQLILQRILQELRSLVSRQLL